MWSILHILVYTTVSCFTTSLFFVSGSDICNTCSCNVIPKSSLFKEVLEIKCINIGNLYSLELAGNYKELWFYYNELNLSSVKTYNKWMAKLNVTRLSYDSNSIEVIKESNFNDVINLKSLSLSNNCIKNIESNSFTVLTKLENLTLSHNVLTECNLVLFMLPALQRLTLKNNKIDKVIPPLDAIFSLIELDLSNNLIVDMPILDLPNLENLNLAFNSIIHVSHIFPFLKKLKHLNLSNNKIINLDLTVDDLPQIKSISLQHNEISKFVIPSVFEHPALYHLNLNHNKISTIDIIAVNSHLREIKLSSNQIEKYDFIMSLNEIEVLDLSRNQIKNVAVIPKTLLHLNLSHNLISKITDQHMNGGSLLVLDISHSHLLTEIGPNSFRGFFKYTGDGSPTSLDLSNCSISKIDEEAFNDSHLQMVNLSGNQLNHIPKELFNWEKVQVDFQNNPLDCSCPSQWLLDILVPSLYIKNQRLLQDLKCDTPLIYNGIRLVHWYNNSKRVFCETDKTIFGNNLNINKKIQMKSSLSTTLVLAFLGLFLILMVVVGLVMQRRIDLQKRSRLNRRLCQ